jgi:hypothetical protein
VSWLIVPVFAFGMIALLNWRCAVTRQRTTVFGMMTIAAFAIVLVLGSAILE